MPADVALYIHVPFCRRKCPYCSFVSYGGREGDIPAYLAALKTELKSRAGGEHVSSIYLGGGTPSLLSAEQISGLMEYVGSLFSIDKAAEISMEANPGTVDAAYLAAAREAGINRLSLGVQSLDDGELKLLGRIHTAAEARQAVRDARAAGYDNLNLDFIYGLPGQALKDWWRTLEAAMAMQPEHVSLYALTLEEGTPLAQAVGEGTLPAPDADAAADGYELAEDLLSAAGYGHYEISNWARPGRECRHNLAYWHNWPYIGAGAGAHSCLNGRRLANKNNLEEYMANPLAAPETDEEISPALALAETVILGLRLGEGIDPEEVNNRYGTDMLEHYRQPVEQMTAAGLLEQPDGRLRLTRRGRLLSNEVFWRFLPG